MLTSATSLVARTVDDLLGLVPPLLGFHPAESLVVILLENTQVMVTAHVELSKVGPTEVELPRAEPSGMRPPKVRHPRGSDPDVLKNLLSRLRARFPLSETWVIAYTADSKTAWWVLRRCEQFLAGTCLGILHVDGAFWWSTPDGPPGEYAPELSAISAQAARSGLIARSSRQEVAATIDGPTTSQEVGLAEVFRQERARLASTPLSEWPTLMRQAIAEPTNQNSLTIAQCVRLVLLAQESAARDVVLLSLKLDNAAEQLALWRQVIRKCPLTYQGYLLGLIGLAAWLAGEGILQTVCLKRAEALDASMPLIKLLRFINETVLPPSSWPAIRYRLVR